MTCILYSQSTDISFLYCNTLKVLNVVLKEDALYHIILDPKNYLANLGQILKRYQTPLFNIIESFFSFITLWTSMMFWVVFVSFIYYKREKREREWYQWISRTYHTKFYLPTCKQSSLYSTLVDPLLTFYFMMFLLSCHTLTEYYKSSHLMTHKTESSSFNSSCYKGSKSLK